MLPNVITNLWIATPLTTQGNYQFACWYTGNAEAGNGEVRIGRITRGTHAWGNNHEQVQIGEPLRTTPCAMPLAIDEHNFPAIMPDGRGHLWAWVNMHGNPMRCIVTDEPHTDNLWQNPDMSGWSSAAAAFPSSDVRNTYPIPVKQSDGSIWFFSNTGPANSGAARMDSVFWTLPSNSGTWSAMTTIFKGISIPGAGSGGGVGSDATNDTASNYSAYPGIPVVEGTWQANPGRMHMTWAWRVEAGPDNNYLPGYAYSDNQGQTWKAKDGTTLTLPMTPLTVKTRIQQGGYVTAISRTSNVVTATLDTSAHGMTTNDPVTVFVDDNTYNGSFTVTGTPTATTLTWAQVAADDADGGVGCLGRESFRGWGNVAVDAAGNPTIIGSHAPRYLFTWSGGPFWNKTQVSNPLNGDSMSFVTPQGFHFRNSLWSLNTSTTVSTDRRAKLWQHSTNGAVITLSGLAGVGGALLGGDVSCDAEAWRLHRSVEVLVCDGNIPRVATYGTQARAAVA